MTKEEFLKDLSAVDSYPLEWQERVYEAMSKACSSTAAMLELKRRAGVTEEHKWNSPELELMYYQTKMRQEELNKKGVSVFHKLLEYIKG